MACWGFPNDGRTDPTSNPQIDQNTKFLAVSAGNVHTCAIKIDGTMACWGFSDHDQTNPTSSPQIDQNTKFLAVSAGNAHSCGIKEDGSAACWGNSDNGRTSSPSDKLLALSTGSAHSCGIKIDGTMACWGGQDQFPSGETTPTRSPQGVTENTRFLAVSAGSSHSCGIKEDGSAACWGNSDDGQTNLPAGFKAQIIPDTIRLFERAEVLEDAVALEDLKIEAYTDRLIIPEGTTAPILIRANQPSTVSIMMLEPDAQTMDYAFRSFRATKQRTAFPKPESVGPEQRYTASKQQNHHRPSDHTART